MIPAEWLQYAPKPKELTGNEKWNVFLSYRSVNRGWVLNLYDVLTELGFKVDRLDQSTYSGHIPQIFLEHLERADAVIADITDTNPNVMYEIGHVHGRRTAPFLFWRSAREELPPNAPFYFKPENFRLVDPADEQDRAGFGAALREYLREAMSSGMPPWPSDPNATKLR